MAEEIIKEFDVKIEKSDPKLPLYEKLLEQFKKDGETNVELCWRMVRACIAIADCFEKEKKMKESKNYIEKSYEHAQKAIQLDPNSVQAQKWFCASVGRMAPLSSTKERIKFGHTFKEHRDIVVKMEPNDMLMNHMYGRWCYEVASLSFMERKIAETFFATPPKATYEEALESLKAADAAKHDWKLNQLWMAKTYAAMKKYPEVIQWVDTALALPIESEEDGVSQIELETLEKKYSSYRKK